jgi:hypothetical protein
VTEHSTAAAGADVVADLDECAADEVALTV